MEGRGERGEGGYPLITFRAVLAHFSPRTANTETKSAQDRQHRLQERPRIANIALKKRRPKTTNIGPQSGPRPSR